MAANLTGIVSGLDTGKIIEATLASKKRPIDNLKAQRKGVQSKISAIGQIKSELVLLEDHMKKMETQADVLALTGETGDEDILTVSATGDATEGDYDINVSQLAVAAKERGDAFDTKSTLVKAGTLTIVVDGEIDDEVTITIAATDSLLDVADKINASDAAVNAALVFDGDDYYLQITNVDTGFSTGSAAEALVITESYTGLSGQQLNLLEVVPAQNAKVNIDGLAMEFSDNSISEALEGITLDLVTIGTTSFSVTNDKEGVKENIQAFVDQYNSTIAMITKHLKVSETSDRQSSLAGDSTISGLKNRLQDIITQTIPGLTGTFDALSHIGIRTKAGGQLKIDDDDLSDAIDQDIRAVGKLFTFEDTVTEDKGITQQIFDLTELYAENLEGLLKEKTDSFNDQIGYYTDRIIRLEARLANTERRLVMKFSKMEVAISLLQAQGKSLTGLGGGK